MKQTSLTVHRYERNIDPAIGKVNVCLFCSEAFNHPNHIGYSPVKTAKQQAYLFFLRNAGYCYDPKTQTKQQGKSEGARKLAAAERDARAMGYTFEWTQDVDGCIGCSCDSPDCDCSAGRPHECLVCLMRDAAGICCQALGSICKPSREYRRVIEAELAIEEVGK
jgi:hypothetical protein